MTRCANILPYTDLVRRLLILFLVLVLPLQFAWAGAAAYCQHESGSAAKHFGHHEHQHHGGNADTSKLGKPQFAGADADCQTCQFAAAQSVPALAHVFDAPAGSLAPPSPPSDFHSHVPPGLERPNCTLAA